MVEVILFNSHPSHGPECGGNVSLGKTRVISVSQHIIMREKKMTSSKPIKKLHKFRTTAHSYNQVAKLQTVHKSLPGHVVRWGRRDDFNCIHFYRSLSSPLHCLSRSWLYTCLPWLIKYKSSHIFLKQAHLIPRQFSASAQRQENWCLERRSEDFSFNPTKSTNLVLSLPHPKSFLLFSIIMIINYFQSSRLKST